MALYAWSFAAVAQTDELTARLEKVRSLYSLDSADQSPWHSKMDITVFDDKGKHPQPRTIEVWRDGKNRKTVFSVGGAESTWLRLADGTNYISATKKYIPYRAVELLDHVLQAGPELEDLKQGTPVLEEHTFDKLQLECVMLLPDQQMKQATLGLFPTYCFQPESDQLILSYDMATEVVLFQKTGEFLKRQVPMQLKILENGSIVATGVLSSLTTYHPQASDFTPTQDMKNPKDLHVSGTFDLSATIDRSGHVLFMRPLSAADPNLIVATITNLRRLIYKRPIKGATEDIIIRGTFQLNPKP